MTSRLPDPYIGTEGNLTLRHGTGTWTDSLGNVKGVARMGGVTITFHSADQVREVIAYLAVLIADMDAKAAKTADDGDPLSDDPAPYWPALGLDVR